MSNPTSPSLKQANESKKNTDNAITKMKSHLDEISKLMENIQLNTSSIDNKVARCENIICTTFEEISHALEKRKENLIAELHKTAKNKKLSLLIQHNELNSKYQESQNKINKIDESVQNQKNEQKEFEQKISAMEVNNMNIADQDMIIISNYFDLHFNSNYNRQLIQMINHFGSISANIIPILSSLKNNSKNFVVEIEWKLPSSHMAIDLKKTQKLRIEWSNTKQLKWNHREFVICDDDKKQNQTDAGCKNLINVGGNGTYIFRIKHYYLNVWSKNSNSKSISISGISYDFWSKVYHGDNISVEGKCIVLKNRTGYQSAFLSNIASVADDGSDSLHHWTFKIEGGHKSGSSRIFGIWRDVDVGVGVGDGDGEEMKVDINKMLNTYFTNEKFVNPNSNQAYGKPFGDKCHEGDEIDMFLDLNKLKLFYKLNGIIYGKPMDIARANYKAVVSFYYMDDRVRLLRYRKS